ncbi:hypothetical protein FRC14_002468 [Serendipita sp. 396]|nr:hypothetical protein FRC14_002468 [Serendipita sp. 396]KAG8827384.1 hypothetical protein FRC19_003533 [Serendipita sp. 401]KAG8838299.1 hypothetical protein FRC18_005215 [Serendipita sp. 400]KAG8860443.1 hypothetical protein FRB91_003138 [Serendipita sp. 411]KAG8875621.1 hypothetical protein FRC20_003488 [Serendipita sp. 405]KAG9057883.1 hypothetical protein FS842_003203 [Serendipita sp. 407]
MTGRSYDSIASERRLRRNRVTDEDLFNYTLRVAYLSFLLTPRAPQAPSAASLQNDARDSRDYQSRLSSITNSFASFGDLIRDVGGRDGPKQIKFPEKFLRVLDQRMQDIAMGKDQTYHDQITRRTIARFWTTFKDPTFYRQMERNRKVEELILNFVTTASTSLRQDPQLAASDAWKLELNNQIAYFTRIVRDALKSTSHVPPELTQRIDMYVSKLVPSTTALPPIAEASNRPESVTATATLADMVLVRVVGRLFDKSDDELQREINSIKRICTEKAALIDLKTCLQNINAGLPFPGRREDFPDDTSFQHWKSLEQTHLSQLMVIMVQFNPELAKSTPSDAYPGSGVLARPESIYSSRASISSRQSVLLPNGDLPEAGDDDLGNQSFTYIPPNPKRFYKKLIEKCIEFDLQAMHSLPEDQEVPLGILSTSHLDVINECALRWRIMQSYRVSCFLDVIKYKYEREEVPLECIPEALNHVEKDFEPERWPLMDREYLGTVYSSVFNIFLASLYHSFEQLPYLKRKAISPYLSILERVKASGLLEIYDVDIAARIGELSDRIRILAMHHYTDKSSGILSNPGINRALPLILLSEGLEEVATKLHQTFKQPLLGEIDIVGLFVETQVPLFLTDLEESKRHLLESSSNQPTPDTPIEDIFTLYKATKALFALVDEYAPKTQHQFEPGSFFEPYVQQWLLTTDSKTLQWVQSAVSVDTFEPKGAERNSSSVVDLFYSLDTPINFLMDLGWPDPYQEARFCTSLAKTVSKLMEQYCRSIEETFMEEMFPRVTDPYLQPQRQSAWLEKAKQSIQGEKKIDPFNFKPESCVKLNNIGAARGLLDKIYTRVRADEMSRILKEHAPAVPPKAVQRHLFTVKIVMAENLDSDDSSSLDTFATLSDEHGHRIAKTRTIYDTPDPRWEETFDVSVESPLWLMASVRDRSLVGKHDIVARCYICLDPRRYGDFLAHDVWMDLEPHGRILLRISMEGEQDDILFFFGRAFRSLKRTEGDMVRIFVDKMTPLFRDVLSRSNLKKITKLPSALDYNKALGNVTALFGSLTTSSSSEVQIPLPQHEKPRVKVDSSISDEAVEAALGPLYDYLNDNLQVLNDNLSEAARETVMSKIWKEILVIVEGLLVPSIGDTPSPMKPLQDRELDVVFKWLRSLLNFFHAEGEGMSMETLQNAKYREIMSLRLYYDWHADQLMEEAVRMMQTQLRAAPTIKKRAKSVYSQRSLGTIKDRKKEKRRNKQGDNAAEPILKILRMMPGTTDFLQQQLKIMSQIQAEQQNRNLHRQHARGDGDVPAIPPLPPK